MGIKTQEQPFNPLLYPSYEVTRGVYTCVDSATRMVAACQTASLDVLHAWGLMPTWLTDPAHRISNAALTISHHIVRDYPKPEFGLVSTQIDGRNVAVHETVARDAAGEPLERPFGRLLHFERDTERVDPPVLLVAPMSGHYASLLRDTVDKLLPAHEVYITDWANARDVPREHGEFGLDDYIAYVQGYIETLGPETNVLAVCQSTVPSLAAIAHLAKTKPEAQPATVTLMAGPLDVKASPTTVSEYADKFPISWFARQVIAKVPASYPGHGRLVYPGFLQLISFMSMNPASHLEAHQRMFSDLVEGDELAFAKTRAFYDEYGSVLDLDRKFYLDTVARVFQQRELARGVMRYAGVLVEPSAIDRTAVLTVEGERDDISAPGQTTAAHVWLSNLPPEKHFHHLQAEVGHYGVFSGSRWSEEILPIIMQFVRNQAAQKGIDYAPIDSQRLRQPQPFN